MSVEEDLLELLKINHNIDVKLSDVHELNEWYYKQKAKSDTRLYYQSNDSKLALSRYPIHNGKVFKFLAIGLLVGVGFLLGGVTGALIAASIGWKLFGSKKNKQKEEEKGNAGRAFGIDSVTSIPPISDPIPLIFCNVDQNPKGGVITSGFLVNSRVETVNNTQKIYQLFVLGLGTIGSIDINRTTINDQPKNNFFADSVKIKFLPGTPTQQPFPEFPYYSNATSPESNNTMGCDGRIKIPTGQSGWQSVISLDQDDIDTITPSDFYSHNGQYFRVTSKSSGSITVSPAINVLSEGMIIANYHFSYSTSKRVNQLDIHLNASYWKRLNNPDTGSDLVRHAGVFDVYLARKSENYATDRLVLQIGIRSKSQSNLRRSFKIRNLPFDFYKIQIYPRDRFYLGLTTTGQSVPVYELDDSGIFRTININGYEIEMEGGLVQNFSMDDLRFDGNASSWASQGSAPVQITSINEIVYPSQLGHQSTSGYPGLAVVSVVTDASNQITGSPNYKFFVDRGLDTCRRFYAAGEAMQGSTGSSLYDVLNFHGYVQPGMIVRNLDKHIQSSINDSSNGVIASSQSLGWEPGNRYVVFDYGATSYFPDIFVYTLDTQFSSNTNTDYFVDFISIARAKHRCIAEGLFWDGVIAEDTEWQAWAIQEAIGSLLHVSKTGGVYGLSPEEPKEPSYVFNASNMKDFKIDPSDEITSNTLIMTYSNNVDSPPKQDSLVCMTVEAWEGLTDVIEKPLTLLSVTNEEQIKKVGRTYLKSPIYQNKRITFTTGLQAAYLQPGDNIIVQHLVDQTDPRDVEGFVTAVNMITDQNGLHAHVTLSKPIPLGIDIAFRCAVYHTQNKITESDKLCDSIVDPVTGEVKLAIYFLSQNIQISTGDTIGDLVVVSRTLRVDKYYKLNRVNPTGKGEIGIEAINWSDQILNDSGLIFVD